MPRGIPNHPPAKVEEDEDAELARMIAEDEAAKAESDAALAAQAEERAEQQRTADAKIVLLEQAEALGLKVHHRWSVETLAERVLEAQEAAKQAEEAKFADAPKVWVFLLRGAYP